ncbi:MAG: hypothetical protein WCO90_08330 [Planctomycetota bacterium]
MSLILLGVGLSVTQLVENLFARSEGLGFVGLGFAVAAALALLVVIAREALGLAPFQPSLPLNNS